jgi:hypothetical protein
MNHPVTAAKSGHTARTRQRSVLDKLEKVLPENVAKPAKFDLFHLASISNDTSRSTARRT